MKFPTNQNDAAASRYIRIGGLALFPRCGRASLCVAVVGMLSMSAVTRKGAESLMQFQKQAQRAMKVNRLASVTPPTPVAAPVVHAARPATPPTPLDVVLPKFIYPSNASNYWWTLQGTMDMRHWTNLATGMRFPVYGTSLIKVTNMFGAYRMMGTTNP